jgi:hypothetical protein
MAQEDDISEDEAKRIVLEELFRRLCLGGANSDSDSGESIEEYKSDQSRELFAHYGLAMYYAQVLEHEIVNLLVLARIVEAQENAERILSDPWEDRFRDTFGRLFRKLEPFLAGDKKLVDDLGEAVRVRNRLAHSYWRDHVEECASLYGRDEMIRGLIETREMFVGLDGRLEPVHAQLYDSLGITDEKIKDMYNEMKARAQERDKGYKITE